MNPNLILWTKNGDPLGNFDMGNKPPGRKFAESCRSWWVWSWVFFRMGSDRLLRTFVSWNRRKRPAFRFGDEGHPETSSSDMRWARIPRASLWPSRNSIGRHESSRQKMGNSFVFPEIVSRNNKSIGRSLLLKKMSLGLTGYILKKT